MDEETFFYKNNLEKAFDSGFDAGLYRGFDNANKEQSKQIIKPKAMNFKEFLKQNGIA